MAGNITGGKKAAATNKAKYGEDWYRKIGQKGANLALISRKGLVLTENSQEKQVAKEGGRVSVAKKCQTIYTN